MLDSKSGTNDHPISPFDTRMCLISGHTSHVSNVSKHQSLLLKWKSKSKSGMNGHPTRPFDTIIEPVDSPMNSLGFYGLKTPNYRLQERLISKKLVPPKKKCPKHMFFGESSYLIPGDPWDPHVFVFFDFFQLLNIPLGSPGIPGVPQGIPGGPRGPRG